MESKENKNTLKKRRQRERLKEDPEKYQAYKEREKLRQKRIRMKNKEYLQKI